MFLLHSPPGYHKTTIMENIRELFNQPPPPPPKNSLLEIQTVSSIGMVFSIFILNQQFYWRKQLFDLYGYFLMNAFQSYKSIDFWIKNFCFYAILLPSNIWSMSEKCENCTDLKWTSEQKKKKGTRALTPRTPRCSIQAVCAALSVDADFWCCLLANQLALTIIFICRPDLIVTAGWKKKLL